MGALSVWHWFFVLIALSVWVVPLFPTWRALQKAGLNPAWALLWLIPYVGGLCALCVLAYSRWPYSPAEKM